MLSKYNKALVCWGVGVLVLFAGSSEAQEQSNKSNFDLGADIVSRYYWRGVNLSSSPAIQPYIEYSYGGFAMGTWGSYSFATEPYQEVDLYISYEQGNAKFIINDCFALVDSIDISQHYLNWNNKSTTHAVEASLELSNLFKSAVSLTGGMYFYGDDKSEEGKNYFSTYLEAQYNVNVGQQPVVVFVGGTPCKGMYGDQASLVNVGISMERDLFANRENAIPLGVLFAINPHTQSIFMVAKVSF